MKNLKLSTKYIFRSILKKDKSRDSNLWNGDHIAHKPMELAITMDQIWRYSDFETLQKLVFKKKWSE